MVNHTDFYFLIFPNIYFMHKSMEDNLFQHLNTDVENVLRTNIMQYHFEKTERSLFCLRYEEPRNGKIIMLWWLCVSYSLLHIHVNPVNCQKVFDIIQDYTRLDMYKWVKYQISVVINLLLRKNNYYVGSLLVDNYYWLVDTWRSQFHI